jgi:ribose 5-phosphate isomerase B
MKISVASDERTHLTEAVVEELRRRGHRVELLGALIGDNVGWSEAAHQVAGRVAGGQADQGILFCWTGTGVCMAANKVSGVRAALCTDVESARGARAWNDANVLCLSLRGTSEAVAREMLDAWFSAQVDESERENIERVQALDRGRGPA